MNRNNLSKLILLTFLMFAIFSFIPVVEASSGNVTKRPLDDWLDPNYAAFPWGEKNWAFYDFWNPYSGLVMKMGLPWPKAGLPDFPYIKFDMIYENSLVEGVTVITGTVTERALNDGTALITLHLDVKNSPVAVYLRSDFNSYCYGLADKPQAVLGDGIDGYLDYKVVTKFIIPEPGAELPNVFDMWYYYISINIHGICYGTLTERAVELGFAETAGAPGMVKLHSIALFKPDFKETHPKYDPFYGDLWPVDSIEVYELS